MTYNTKSIIYIIVTILIIIALFFGAKAYREKHGAGSGLSLSQIKELSDEEKKQALEKRITDLEGQVQALKEDADAGAKFSIYMRLAEARIEDGNFKEALDALNAIPAEKKESSRVYLAYGLAYKGIGDNDAATIHLKRSLELDDTQAVAWLARLDADQNLPDTAQVLRLYKEAISKTKSNIDIMISYAKYNEKIGDKVTARAAWETAINVDPNNAGKYQAEIDKLK